MPVGLYIICSSLLRNFLKSVHKDGEYTQDHDSNWNISNPVIGRVNKIHINNTFIDSTYQYKKELWHEIELYAHKFTGIVMTLWLKFWKLTLVCKLSHNLLFQSKLGELALG